MDTGRTAERVRVEVRGDPRIRHERLLAEVREGLTRTPKELPPKYFYDARGSELFERITRLPEYYPTRSETAILEACSDAFLEAVRPVELVEIGSGSSSKTELLLPALRRVGGTRYVPLDVSAAALRDAVERLAAEYPWLTIHGFVDDFEDGFPDLPREGRRLVCFLGSTIGNLEADERVAFLRRVRALLRPGDGFLLGVDLLKDPAVLEAAYDDSQGVTAAFDKNVLRVLNREAGADFREEDFRHVARFDAERGRVEMLLEAQRPLSVRLTRLDLEVRFERGERLRTEISCKFERRGVERELGAAGMRVRDWRTDPEGNFALALAVPA